MALSYNVQALPDYVEQNRPDLIAKAVIGAKSADLFSLISGVKGPTALNLIGTEIEFGDGSTCGWDEAGTTSLSQAILTPRALKINMSICDKVLLSKWANYLVKVQANKTDRDLPFEEEFIDSVIANVKAGVEKMIYQGDSTNTNAVEFDGLIKILTNGSPIAPSFTSGGSAYDFVKAIAAAMPAEILDKDDLVVLVGMDLYNEYIQDLVTANLFHYDPANGDNGYMIPGTKIKVIGVNGLNGTNKGIGASLSNLFYGCNLQDGDEIFDLWFSKDNREFRLAIEFIAGVQVAYDTEVVFGTKN